MKIYKIIDMIYLIQTIGFIMIFSLHINLEMGTDVLLIDRRKDYLNINKTT